MGLNKGKLIRVGLEPTTSGLTCRRPTQMLAKTMWFKKLNNIGIHFNNLRDVSFTFLVEHHTVATLSVQYADVDSNVV